MFYQVKVFRKELDLFESQLSKTSLDLFETCNKCLNETDVPFPLQYAIKNIMKLHDEFQTSFIDITK